MQFCRYLLELKFPYIISGTCYNTTKICPSNGDLCASTSCNPSAGCDYAPISCSDNSKCTTDYCDISVGCVYESLDCNDGSACTIDTCDPNSGCVNTKINCTDNNDCTLDTCNDEIGCLNILYNCDDNDACTTDFCIPYAGNISINNIIEDTVLVSNSSLIIPMDNTYQGSSGIFNLRAYGMATYLLHGNVWMYWAIKKGKSKDETDITATVRKLKPTSSSTLQTLNFKAGPLIIPGQFRTTALSIIDSFNALGGTAINVYEVVGDQYFYVKNQLLHKPFIGVLNSGNNYPIQVML